MTPLAKALKRIAAQVARRQDFAFKEYLDRGLEEILEEATDGNYNLQQVVSQCLWRLCVHDGKYNNFNVGLLTVMQLLREQRGGGTADQTQQFRDLLAILNQGGPLAAIEGWVNTNYP